MNLIRARIRINIGFLIHSRREWSEVFEVLKKRLQQPRILYTVKSSFKSVGKIVLSQKLRLMGFVDSRHPLQEMLNEYLQKEIK